MKNTSDIITSENQVIIKIYQEKTKYDNLLLTENDITSKLLLRKNVNQLVIVYRDLSAGDGKECNLKNISTPVFYIDGIVLHYVVQELRISPAYRKMFITNAKLYENDQKFQIVFKLVPAKKEIIDYEWNYRTVVMAWERVELDHALSWLSTLGGAFSALGDYFSNCALMAGKISFHQLKLALRLGDPTIASRCRLYFSLSLIQRGYLKQAQCIIQQEYIAAKKAIVIDIRLVKMCLGIWAKLKYEYSRKIKKKKTL